MVLVSHEVVVDSCAGLRQKKSPHLSGRKRIFRCGDLFFSRRFRSSGIQVGPARTTRVDKGLYL